MDKLLSSSLKVGIIAGGQLGKMLIQAASKWDIATYVLDPDPNCPAGKIATAYTKGDILNFDDVYNFGKQVDLLTFEIENVNTEALKKLQKEGVIIAPDPTVLELIQDKGLQKLFYRNHHIPTSSFILVDGIDEIKLKIQQKEIKFPFVQKLRKGGYDGRGVAVIKTENELNKLLPGASVIEHLVEIEKEIAVIVARNKNGETKCFPAVEMDFNPEANLVEKLICPSTISENQKDIANQLAEKLITELNMVGLLAVEFFIDKNGEVIINEVAPRPHNSGHHTIESIITSQFEQHLRAILNLPLGSTEQKLPAVMLNLLGEKNYQGPVYYQGLEKALAINGVNIHLYGKKITRPGRKMGHITIIGKNIDTVLQTADKVKNTIQVIAKPNQL
jgi:5-(carboxyamino)imidazole ribonucleotide synthase